MRVELPPFDGGYVVKLHNAGHSDAVARLVATAKEGERRRERDKFIQIAALLFGGDARSWASRVHHRLVELANDLASRILPIDVTKADGALAAALVVCGWRAPESRDTVYRAMTARRPNQHRRGSVPI